MDTGAAPNVLSWDLYNKFSRSVELKPYEGNLNSTGGDALN